MSNIALYKDPKRKVGSQSETPKIIVKEHIVHVSGYQQFTIDKQTTKITYGKKRDKFASIDSMLKTLHDKGCKSIVDVGCSSGLVSFIAFKNKFQKIVSLDHDAEYIKTLRTIKEICEIKTISERVFQFGAPIQEKFDIVFCGAIIHWIFSLTADFRSFKKIIQYLLPITNKYLIIEWVHENDRAIKSFHHTAKRKENGDEAYTTNNFENAVKSYASIVSKQQIDGATRTMYIIKK